jgi:Flp pilus assembly pilin Flp
MVRTFCGRTASAMQRACRLARGAAHAMTSRAAVVASGGAMLAREEGQTTAEYALVILAAAAVALVLLAWAKTSGKLPAFFDSIIDSISSSV